jgi:hypothetical protein
MVSNTKEPKSNLINSTTSAKDITDWPGAFGIYQISKTAMTKNFKTFIKLAISFGVFYILDIAINLSTRNNSGINVLVRTVFELLGILLSSTLIFSAIRSVGDETVSVGDAFSAVTSNAINIIITGIFVGVLAVLSILLLIIPAFFVIPRIYLAIYFVVDQKLGPIESIKTSWDVTKGNVGKVYGILGVGILIFLPIITVIGLIATVYFGFMYLAAPAVLYVYITKNQKEKLLNN